MVFVFSLDWFKIYTKPFTNPLVLEETKLLLDSIHTDPVSAFTDLNYPPFTTALRAFPVLVLVENYTWNVFSRATTNSTFSYSYLFPPLTGAKYYLQIIV